MKQLFKTFLISAILICAFTPLAFATESDPSADTFFTDTQVMTPGFVITPSVWSTHPFHLTVEVMGKVNGSTQSAMESYQITQPTLAACIGALKRAMAMDFGNLGSTSTNFSRRASCSVVVQGT